MTTLYDQLTDSPQSHIDRGLLSPEERIELRTLRVSRSSDVPPEYEGAFDDIYYLAGDKRRAAKQFVKEIGNNSRQSTSRIPTSSSRHSHARCTIGCYISWASASCENTRQSCTSAGAMAPSTSSSVIYSKRRQCVGTLPLHGRQPTSTRCF